MAIGDWRIPAGGGKWKKKNTDGGGLSGDGNLRSSDFAYLTFFQS